MEKINVYDIRYLLLIAFIIVVGDIKSIGQQKTENVFFGFSIDDKGKSMLFFTEKKLAIDVNKSYCKLNDGKKQPVVVIKEQPSLTIWKVPVDKKYLEVVLMDSIGNTYVFDTTFCKEYGYWLLSVGTGDNLKDTIDNLKYSVQDAKAFFNTIRSKGGEPEKGILLNDYRATKSGIKASFDSINYDIKEKPFIAQKAVVVYLSGHGRKTKEKYSFQVKNEDGIDADWLDENTLANWICSLVKDNDVVVWLFVDTCESIDLYQYSENNNSFKGLTGSIIRYSTQIKSNNDNPLYYNGNDVKHKKCTNANYVIESSGDDRLRLTGKAIDGLFEHLFQQAVPELPIEESLLTNNLSNSFDKHLGDRKEIHLGNEDLLFPVKMQKEGHDKEQGAGQVHYFDAAIGYNVSNQLNTQIGYSWRNWSFFAELSGFWDWQDSITYLVDSKEFQGKVMEKMPSKSILGIGAGVRWYPVKDFDYIGIGVSAQVGGAFGKMVVTNGYTIDNPGDDQYVQDIITKQGWRNYVCITPSVSLRSPAVYKKFPCRFFINTGYAFYFSFYEKVNFMNREMDKPPVVFNAGVSIPIGGKNK